MVLAWWEILKNHKGHESFHIDPAVISLSRYIRRSFHKAPLSIYFGGKVIVQITHSLRWRSLLLHCSLTMM